MESTTKSKSWYRTRLFVKPWKKFNMLVETEGLLHGRAVKVRSWKVIGAVTLCVIRPIDRIAVPEGDTYLLERLGLQHLGNTRNRQLAQQLRDMP